MSFAEGDGFDAGKREGDSSTRYEERSGGVRRNGIAQVETFD